MKKILPGLPLSFQGCFRRWNVVKTRKEVWLKFHKPIMVFDPRTFISNMYWSCSRRSHLPQERSCAIYSEAGPHVWSRGWRSAQLVNSPVCVGAGTASAQRASSCMDRASGPFPRSTWPRATSAPPWCCTLLWRQAWEWPSQTQRKPTASTPSPSESLHPLSWF